MENILIIIPAYNVSGQISKVLWDLDKYKNNCLFINDGSTDNTFELIEKEGFTVFNKLCNDGVSKAVLMGLKYALENNYEYAVLMDADGQHNPQDIDKFVKELEVSDVVFANRFASMRDIPSCKIVANAFAAALYKEVANYFIPDVACGYKGFKISQEVVDYLSNAAGYSVIYKLVNYFIRRDADIKYILTKAIYYSDCLLCTRIDELIALLRAVIELDDTCMGKKSYELLDELLKKVLKHQNFDIILCNINFSAFYLKEYNSYIFQAPLDRICDLYK